MINRKNFNQNKRPHGEQTRGKTAPNRLRRMDFFAIKYDPLLLKMPGKALYADLGFGKDPTTTLESAFWFRKLNPGLPVLGIEIDPVRVEEARSFQNDKTFFRLGGFNLPVDSSEEPVRLIRAFNVLRQYKEEAVYEAHRLMGSYLIDGGLLIEGTSDPFGRLCTANIIRKKPGGELKNEALVFSFNLRLGFDPGAIQPVLPKNYIHRMVPGQEIFEFFEAWKGAYNQMVSQGIPPGKQLFKAAARQLAASGYSVDLRRKWLSYGYLIWYKNRAAISAI